MMSVSEKAKEIRSSVVVHGVCQVAICMAFGLPISVAIDEILLAIFQVVKHHGYVFVNPVGSFLRGRFECDTRYLNTFLARK